MIQAAYGVISLLCNHGATFKDCRWQETYCIGLDTRNKEIGIFEVVTPEFLIQDIKEKTGWVVDSDGNCWCPKHASMEKT